MYIYFSDVHSFILFFIYIRYMCSAYNNIPIYVYNVYNAYKLRPRRSGYETRY